MQRPIGSGGSPPAQPAWRRSASARLTRRGQGWRAAVCAAGSCDAYARRTRRAPVPSPSPSPIPTWLCRPHDHWAASSCAGAPKSRQGAAVWPSSNAPGARGRRFGSWSPLPPAQHAQRVANFAAQHPGTQERRWCCATRCGSCCATRTGSLRHCAQLAVEGRSAPTGSAVPGASAANGRARRPARSSSFPPACQHADKGGGSTETGGAGSEAPAASSTSNPACSSTADGHSQGTTSLT